MVHGSKMSYKEYKVHKDVNFTDFTKAVQKYLEDGWEPLGPMVPIEGGTYIHYTQTLVKTQTPKTTKKRITKKATVKKNDSEKES